MIRVVLCAVGPAFGPVVKGLPKMPVSCIGVPGFESRFHSRLQFTVHADTWRLQVMTQVVGILPPAWET